MLCNVTPIKPYSTSTKMSSNKKKSNKMDLGAIFFLIKIFDWALIADFATAQGGPKLPTNSPSYRLIVYLHPTRDKTTLLKGPTH